MSSLEEGASIKRPSNNGTTRRRLPATELTPASLPKGPIAVVRCFGHDKCPNEKGRIYGIEMAVSNVIMKVPSNRSKKYSE